jgi:hypothetical protein
MNPGRVLISVQLSIWTKPRSEFSVITIGFPFSTCGIYSRMFS